MKTLRLLLCALPLISLLPAQGPEPAPDVAATVPLPALLSPDQLDQLLAPIALYPDALIALILPAAANSTDIVLAARYLRDNPNDLSQIEHRAWDESVKSLTHYPDVLKWLDENLPWTKQVGEAFSAQPAEVMNAIQRLRTRAEASGALVNTPQQQVLAEPGAIRIVPTDPEVIYVPRYDPTVVFVDRPYYDGFYAPPLIGFGFGWGVGSWLAYDFDWRRHTLWVGDRHRPWQGRHDWHHPVVPIPGTMPSYAYRGQHPPRPWQPPVRNFRPPPARTVSAPRPTPGGNVLPRTFGRVPATADPRLDQTRSSVPAITWARPAPLPPATFAQPPVVSPVVPPTAPATTANSRYAGPRRDRSRDEHARGRSDPAAATTTAPLPTVPALRVAGPTSSVRPTVVAPRPVSVQSAATLGYAPAPAYVAPRNVAPPSGGRTYAAPAPRPVVAPPPAPSYVPPPAVTAPPSTPATESRPAPSGNGRGAPSRRVLD